MFSAALSAAVPASAGKPPPIAAPLPTPTETVPTKGIYGAWGESQPVAGKAAVDIGEGGEDGVSGTTNRSGNNGANLDFSSDQIAQSVLGEINEACFSESLTGVFCVPGSTLSWGAEVMAVAQCESGFRSEAVGALGERGALQIHPIHRAGMAKRGLDFESERDRFSYAFSMWERSGWSPWSCGEYAVGAVVAQSGEW